MVLLSFSGETLLGPFYVQIKDRTKTQTCRVPRKRPIKENDDLQLYWKVRVRITDKPVHFIGQAICTKVERKKYKDFAYDDDFARRDGFANHTELQLWFGDPSIFGNEEYDVIHFKLQTIAF